MNPATAKAAPSLQPFLYAPDVALPPTVSTGQASQWRTDATWLAYVLTALETCGWPCSSPA